MNNSIAVFTTCGITMPPFLSLQDVDIATDPADNCALYIIAHHRTRSQVRRRPALSARFLFIDHIRCLATKQNLIRHKEMLRHTKMALIAKMLGLPPTSSPTPLNSPRPVILAPPPEPSDYSSTPYTAVSSSATSVSSCATASTPSSPSITHTLASQTLKTSPATNDVSVLSEDIELNSIGSNRSMVSTASVHPLRSLSPTTVHYIPKEEQISLVVPSCLASSPVKLIPPLADNAVTTPLELKESLLLTYRSSSAEPPPVDDTETKEGDDSKTEEPLQALHSSEKVLDEEEKVLDEEEITTGNREEKSEENYCLGSPERKLKGVREYEATVEQLLVETEQPSTETGQLSESDAVQSEATSTLQPALINEPRLTASDSHLDTTSAVISKQDDVKEDNATEAVLLEEDRTVGGSDGLNTSETVSEERDSVDTGVMQ